MYLLCGEEAYLKRQYRNRIRRAVIPEGDTMNYAYYEGKNIPVPEIIDLAETMPFFAERRLIVIENSGFFKTASQELADYIRVMPDTVLLLFVESEVDKRGRLYKAVKDRGSVVELGYQDERTLTLWIASAVKRENKKIREDTVHLLLSRAGTDMENLEQELEKLFSYTASREEITSQDVEEICTTRLENRIFEMVDAVAQKEQKKALDYYYDLVALREPPLKIHALLTRQFRLLLEVKAADLAAQSDYRREEKRAWLETVRSLYERIEAKGDCLTLKELAVTGRDLMEAGIKPGPGLGQALQSLLEIVLEDPGKNTKEYLLSLPLKET